ALATDEGTALAAASPSRPERRRVLVPADPDAPLADFTVLDGELLIVRLRDGAVELTVCHRGTGEPLRTVPLPGLGSIGPLTTDGSAAWFTYTDQITPPTVWCYRAGALTLHETPPGRVEPPAVEVHTLTATSADGSAVPVTLYTPPGSGPRPTILHGYGGFGLPMMPSYAPDSLAWIASGGALAVARLRGGPGTRGQAVRAGKQGVFDDFVAAADLLIRAGRTSPDRLAIWG
ncbi:prolyl oligopeptidase family serine peptidase, partial [Actinocorallia lasiicapitis]